VIQGLVLDGADLFSIDYPYGIYASESTGTINGNYIIRIRRYPISTTCSGGAGIRIDSAPGPVKIVGNTVHDFQCHGIVVYRATNPLIQRNRIWGTALIGQGNDGINVFDSINTTISSNSVSSDWTTEMTSQTFWGINVSDAPGTKIVGNKLSYVSSGVFLSAQCGAIVWGNPDNVQITGNKVTSAFYAILIQVEEFPGDSCTSTANNVTIKGNTLVYPRLVGWLPVRVNSIDHDAGDSELPSVAGLVMTGNKYTAGVDFYTSSGSGIVVQTNTKNSPVPPPAGQ
jgi:parallel beta-helix repeat protein